MKFYGGINGKFAKDEDPSFEDWVRLKKPCFILIWIKPKYYVPFGGPNLTGSNLNEFLFLYFKSRFN